MATTKPSNETNSANKIDYILKLCVEIIDNVDLP